MHFFKRHEEDWKNPHYWYKPTTDKSIISYKNLVFQSLSMIQSNSMSYSWGRDATLTQFFKDVDITAYLLSTYTFQKYDFLKEKSILAYLNKKDIAHYFLRRGCLNPIQNKIFSLHPELSQDKELAIQVLLHRRHDIKDVCEFFKTFIQDKSFILDFIKKYHGEALFLQYFPQDKEISRALITEVAPSQYNSHLFHKSVFEDKKLALKILAQSNGYMFYPYLSETLQNDSEICEFALNHHPHMTVKNSPIKTMDDFIKFMDIDDAWHKELYHVIEKAQTLPFMTNIENIVRLVEYVSDNKLSCYVDLMGDPHFSEHPFQKYLTNISKKNAFIKQFCQSPHGQKILKYKIENYRNFEDFEQKIIPTIGAELKAYYSAFKLDKELNSKPTPKHKNKI